ncbi:hypothetical protein [Aurantibacter sp.]|uniref:hypothetical protein n=1 Tax=Aurantibacter sp. TaxID=2807103 RepID=UPI0032641C44
MKVLKRFFNFYLDASIHVALSVYCLVWLTGYMLDIAIDTNLALFLFFGTIVSYNFVKYGLEAEKYILVANRYHKNIQFFSFVALAFVAYYAFGLNRETWEALIVLSIITGLYAIPVMPNAKNLRSLSGFKIVVVAVVWAGATVILPLLQNEKLASWDVNVETLQRFLIVLALMLPFEIRDLRYDPPELNTIPQRFGITNTKLIGVVLVLAISLLTFLKDNLSILEIVAKIFICITLLLAILNSNKKRSKYYASFWVESLPIIWFVAVWIVDKSF